MYLVADPLEVIHGDEAEEGILARDGLLLSRTTILLRILRLWVQRERSSELARGKIVITARVCGATAGKPHVITCAELSLLDHSFIVLIGSVSCNTLLGHARIIRVVKMIHAGDFLLLHRLKLLLEVLVGHDLVIAAQ